MDPRPILPLARGNAIWAMLHRSIARSEQRRRRTAYRLRSLVSSRMISMYSQTRVTNRPNEQYHSM